MATTRTLMRYHGAKAKLAPWIIQYLPRHRTYVEPYGGAAGILLRKPRSYSEIYNDLDSEIVNVFRVLRNQEQAQELVRQIWLTPYSREEFDLANLPADDPVEQARRTLFRAAAGFATGAQGKYGTGFRSNVNRPRTTPADDWASYPPQLQQIIERLRGVVIEHMPALELILKYDGPETLFYCDPPYVFSTRNKRNAGQTYRHEMADDDHRALAAMLHGIQGMAILSGYPSCAL